ncbi:site-specific integrase [Sediminimonas qiaohouensis]|uniref:site-specific integrase n=1 Tax=Sediminimonas qiaohouensis TaxID=552061 RepID=UPI00040843BF|nr:site-specific integrase [Sediminimonas qiaohouensis]
MFQSLDELIADAEATVAAETSRRVMTEVEDMLDREIAEGKSESSRQRAKSALRSLLRVRNLTPETADLDIEWFDENFPLDGWDPVSMPTLTQDSYLDYRKRVRAAIERVLGIAQKRDAARSARDAWTDMGAWLKACPEFEGLGSRRLIPVTSTLTMGARQGGFQPDGTTDEVFRCLHGAARDSGTRESYRNASALIADLQANPERAEIWTWMRHPISPIRAEPTRTYDLPDHFLDEIEEMTKIAARLRYVTVKETWVHVAEKTRDNYRNTLRAMVSALLATGHISPQANSLRPALEDAEALAAALREWLKWLTQGQWAASTAVRYTGRLPCIFERNDLETSELKRLIEEVDEFHDSLEKREMNEETKAFCRALIERPGFRSDFLLSHVEPRKAAEKILKRAKSRRNGKLMPNEATLVRQLGTVALFSAIECGGAPIRVTNFLGITCIGTGAWLKRISKDRFELTVPAAHTKNKKRIWAPIEASRERYHDTVRWYLEYVRPLYLIDPSTGKSLDSCYLVPKVTDPTQPLPYDTFRGWFLKIMRDVCGIVCTPHNFRHGQASLLYHDNPGLLRTIARRLGDTEQTVVENYAWVHEEIEAERGQAALVAMIQKKGRR